MVDLLMVLAAATAILGKVDLMVKLVNLAVKVVSLVALAVVQKMIPTGQVLMVELVEQELSGVLVDLSQTAQHKISLV